MSNTPKIYEHQFHNPLKNLSGGIDRKNPEGEFAIQFTKAYGDRFLQIHSGTSKKNTVFMREVPISGNGIADLLVFSWTHDLNSKDCADLELEQLNPTIRAFEFKLSNWRKGMMQAHRYKYFSHATILVLPTHKLNAVESHLDIFQKLRVGLWGFDPERGSITCAYTPRPKNQLISKHSKKAMQLATQAICS